MRTWVLATKLLLASAAVACAAQDHDVLRDVSLPRSPECSIRILGQFAAEPDAMCFAAIERLWYDERVLSVSFEARRTFNDRSKGERR